MEKKSTAEEMIEEKERTRTPEKLSFLSVLSNPDRFFSSLF